MILNSDNLKLISHIQAALFDNKVQKQIFPPDVGDMMNQSAVLLPLGPKCEYSDHPGEPCLILNKRSKKVKQAGDLCCPGGSVALNIDLLLSKLLTFPFSPLTKWSSWKKCKAMHPKDAKKLAILYATSLRESLEEMRLNPFGVRFLGVLPAQQLMMRNRFIFPMAGWVNRQKRFFPNWEVEKVVFIPFRNLLNKNNYALFKVKIPGSDETSAGVDARIFPCYIHKENGETDLLWGATYRIVMSFLSLIFEFAQPDEKSLPTIEWQLDENYMTGIRS